MEIDFLVGYASTVLLHIPRQPVLPFCSTGAPLNVHLVCLQRFTWIVFRLFNSCSSALWNTLLSTSPSPKTSSTLFQTDTPSPGTLADMSIKREIENRSDRSSSDSDDGCDNDHATTFDSIPNSKAVFFPVRGTYTRWGPREAFRELVQNW